MLKDSTGSRPGGNGLHCATTLREVPLALGGAALERLDEAESFALLDAFVGSGGTMVDTRVRHGSAGGIVGGESETVIGRWRQARRRRGEIVLTTKVGGLPGGDGLRDGDGLSAAAVRTSVEASLRRLRADHLDLLYTEDVTADPEEAEKAEDRRVSVEELLGALDRLVRAGKVRQIGAAFIEAERLAESMAAAERDGLAAYVAVQPPGYSLVRRRDYEDALAEKVARHGLAVLPYEPLLSLGFRISDPRFDGVSANALVARAYRRASLRGEAAVKELAAVARDRGVALGAVALAWVRAQPGVVAPVASARTRDQLDLLLSSVDVTLTPEELDRLTEFPR
ncbi:MULTISPECIES: aldo/keto reductase [Actinoalloteichus]|uniref:Oxidoreductase, aryl-alcohol dehydrogenase like protein n=1 Tax=Actinoalloteichus fjordicus TaxID=1612552 RepID=A0AAC9LH01_9PSEU|nr:MULTISPECIES: aldo/keto reductase [Actinoalloteichus]APU16607.1 putative oxidoreductase, aryl-alcohol dehydrogenase like protein [Actinoalloteichus fjordicus]APU22673.1 putative oxidoreductase, aryl-alcohol dehydrogenase like protein [Actinoalloteichus sp. GBA129-24]